MAAETVGECAFITSQTIHWATPRPMPDVIMAQPEDFPGTAQAYFFQNLRLLMVVEPAPGAIDLDGSVDRMGTEALIGLGDIFVALLAYAGHSASLLSNTSPRRPVRLQ
jgi:hypothetical protein